MTKLFLDVSQWQGAMDWDAVAPDIDGAIIRCGYGDNIAAQDDGYFYRNVSECERLGIPYGLYLYSYATNANHAYSEAAHAIRLANECSPSYPVFFDSEEHGTESVAAECARIFCTEVESAGYKTGIYASRAWWQSYLDGVTDGTGWYKWVAEWGVSECSIDCDIWQFTSDYYLNGQRFDANYVYMDGDEMTDEQIAKLAKAIYNEFMEPSQYGEDSLKIWSAYGKDTGTNVRNGYNLSRWYQDLLVDIHNQLDEIKQLLNK